MKAELEFIGTIQTPYSKVEECPRNVEKHGPECQIKLHDQYAEGLMGLEAGESILILYWFENTDRTLTLQTNCAGKKITGTFSLRSPNRPNPVAAAERKIEKIEDGILHVRGMDCLNGTKLLDIKPALGCK